MIYVFGTLCAYLLWIWYRSYIIPGTNGKPYLLRIILARTPWFRVFLHYLYQSDPDRDLHNHPWPKALSAILWGGYWETIGRYIGTYGEKKLWTESHRFHTGPSLSREAFKPGAYHRITKVIPGSLTLFLAGRRTRDWGFWVPGTGFVSHAKYLKLKPESSPLYD
jgi:hypothetical protein